MLLESHRDVPTHLSHLQREKDSVRLALLDQGQDIGRRAPIERVPMLCLIGGKNDSRSSESLVLTSRTVQSTSGFGCRAVFG